MIKKIFSIIGDPIAHSLSPIMHNYWFEKYKINAEYNLLKIREDEIKNVIDKIKNEKISGVNVTLPYKKSVIKYLSKPVNDATETHSVNTIMLDEKKEVIGENTDVFGFQAAFLKSFSTPEKKNKKVLILGAGGVAPSIILAFLKSNISNISLSNRTYDRALFIKRKFQKINLIKWTNISQELHKFDILVNATSVGLKGNQEFNDDFSGFTKNSIFIDTIYNPPQTKLIKYFKNKNIKTFNGLNMLIYQGQKSFYLWNKINPEVDDQLIKLLEKEINI